MLDSSFEAQLAITALESKAKFGFQPGKTFDLFAHSRQFRLKHGLRVAAGMGFLPQRRQLFDFTERESQFLGVPHESEVVNLFAIKKAVATVGPSRCFKEAESLVEANRIHGDSGQLGGFTDMDCL
jgi:hypothetical protein